MITTTAPAGRRGPVAHAAGHLGGMNLFLFAWFWAIVVTAVVVGTILLVRLDGPLDAAVSLYSRQGAIWFPFAQTIIMFPTHLVRHVASGMTRRTFVRASLLVAVGTGLAYAVALQVVALAERALHGVAGWGWEVKDAILADESSPAGLLLAELAVVCVAANVSGLLVAAVYQRTNGWWGTLALPLTAGPVVAVLLLLGGVDAGAPPGRFSWAAAAPPLLTSLLVVVVTALAYAAVTSRIPVRPR